jgi:hypothetical protein
LRVFKEEVLKRMFVLRREGGREGGRKEGRK